MPSAQQTMAKFLNFNLGTDDDGDEAGDARADAERIDYARREGVSHRSSFVLDFVTKCPILPVPTYPSHSESSEARSWVVPAHNWF